MNKFNLVLVFVILSTLACRLPSGDVESNSFDCAATLDGVRGLWAQYPFPDYFAEEDAVKQGGEFDPMLYFSVLDHLSMEAGYVLDFVYTNDFLGGYPTLLARPAGTQPYLSWADVTQDTGSYLDHVVVDDTQEGYFQFVVLAIMGEQFYLFWHANYNDLQIVCDREAVQAVIDGINSEDFGAHFTPAQTARALAIPDLPPTVTLGEGTAEVQVVGFTMWGGFYRLTYSLDRGLPHTIQSVDDEQLVPYDCGIMF